MIEKPEAIATPNPKDFRSRVAQPSLQHRMRQLSIRSATAYFRRLSGVTLKRLVFEARPTNLVRSLILLRWTSIHVLFKSFEAFFEALLLTDGFSIPGRVVQRMRNKFVDLDLILCE